MRDPEPENGSMVTVFADERMTGHRPPARHPERPERLQAILRHLDRTGLRKSCRAGKVREATREELLRVHSGAYLDDVALHERMGDGHIEADTWVRPGSNLAALLAAGAGVEAVSQVMEQPGHKALCLVRPPGHHARHHDAMGFCLYGNAAVAASSALAQHALERVLIVDFDVHHGNGTQEMFYDDPRVGFLSIHRFPFYPGSGAKDETGVGAGLGFTRNIPLPFGTSRAEYHAAFRAGLEAFADKIRPELVIISAGFDAHAEDPVGSLGLEVEDFARLTRATLDVADVHSNGRVVSLLEGGYNVSILAGCVAAHLETLLHVKR
ncbi:MAG: histone deacetylase family protein [Isosphaeraceae bacterium]